MGPGMDVCCAGSWTGDKGGANDDSDVTEGKEGLSMWGLWGLWGGRCGLEVRGTVGGVADTEPAAEPASVLLSLA